MKSLGSWLSQSSHDVPIYIIKWFEKEEDVVDFYIDLFLNAQEVSKEIVVKFHRSVIDPLYVIFEISSGPLSQHP
ncbi:hypothetical protein [Rochambeau virus]|uniref:Uncharacterized protein n=1 Tax=Rochambeau virus TaxID=380435 RepID=A0A0D3R1A7_9RHAB|nr:hypothetical protein [Rochambeau virus]AJR28509.1 hypothetical protein [Rochambeau virus]